MKNLRLIVTLKCHNNCEMCCNKDLDIPNIKKFTSFKGFKDIMLTGGEPTLEKQKLFKLISQARQENPKAKIILYTAVARAGLILAKLVDGVTLTLHNREEKHIFLKTLKDFPNYSLTKGKSLRLNIFKEAEFKEYNVVKDWKIQDNMEWFKDCPVPPNEELQIYQG